MPFGELLPALESGKVDLVISGMTATLPRNMRAAFVAPYHVTGKSILARTETLAALGTEELGQTELKVAALAGSTSGGGVSTGEPVTAASCRTPSTSGSVFRTKALSGGPETASGTRTGDRSRPRSTADGLDFPAAIPAASAPTPGPRRSACTMRTVSYLIWRNTWVKSSWLISGPLGAAPVCGRLPR